MRWGDPERILDDATPCMAANGVDRDTARGLIIKQLALLGADVVKIESPEGDETRGQLTNMMLAGGRWPRPSWP